MPPLSPSVRRAPSPAVAAAPAPMLVTLAVAALRLAAGLPAVAVAAAVAATAAAQSAPSDAPSVIVASAERRDVTPSFFYVGRVEAIETVELVARVEGFLEQRDFREGGHVGKGDLLFLIEQAPYRIAVEQREADLAGGARHPEERRGRLRTQGNPGQAQDPGALRPRRGPRRARYRPRRGAAGAGGVAPRPSSTSPTPK